METKPILLCIPDISGFTRFMGELDFELSSKVIPALLNKVIYANEIGLKISEIEGDAVLFYRSGELPSLKDLIDQCRTFYVEFYKEMDLLRKKNNDLEEAKKIPEFLGLKIILHFGKEVGLVPIGKNIKLMGEDVIVAHRLLKNAIEIDEYLLISATFLSHYSDEDMDYLSNWSEVESGHVDVQHLGRINFKYVDLRPIQPTTQPL